MKKMSKYFDVFKGENIYKGLVSTHNGPKKLECYTIADSSESWCREDVDKSSSFRKRTKIKTLNKKYSVK